MKKSKKYISIIIPALALLFISSGLFFSSNLIVSASDENTGDTTTKTVSDSITVNVEDPDDGDDGDDGDEEPECSQKTYKCEKGNATNMKTTEGQNQFVYIWNCELDGETKGCADPMPTCGDFSYNEGSNWTGGCDGGYTAEKKYDKESNTYTWQCRGSLGDPIKECSYKPKDGQCKYIEDYYPRSGSYDPRKIFLCEGEGVKSINHRVDNEKEIVYWDCPGEEGERRIIVVNLFTLQRYVEMSPGNVSKEFLLKEVSTIGLMKLSKAGNVRGLTEELQMGCIKIFQHVIQMMMVVMITVGI